MSARLAFSLGVACFSFPGLSHGQGCSDLFESPPAQPRPGIDVIAVMSCGGSLGQRMATSVDAAGRVTFLGADRSAGETLEAKVDPAVFEELVARAARAVESYLEDGRPPSRVTFGEMLESIGADRLEGSCIRQTDGVDRDVTFRIGGSRTRFVCVGKQLANFNRHVTAVAMAAVNESP